MSKEPMHHVIRLKRYEQPPEGYFEDFLREFHHRQRAELLRPSLSTLIWERICGILPDVRVPAMAYAGATAVAVLAGAVILKSPAGSGGASSYAVSYPSTPVTIDKMQPVSLRVDIPASQSQVFPRSYLLRARPASHESPLSF